MPLSAADHALGELLLHKYDRGKGAEREKDAVAAGSAWQCSPHSRFQQTEDEPVLHLVARNRANQFLKYKGADLHNTWKEGNVPAQARQEANLESKTTSAVYGWWTENRMSSGLNTCKYYNSRKIGQSTFISSQVNPYNNREGLPDFRAPACDQLILGRESQDEPCLLQDSASPHSAEANAVPTSPPRRHCRGPEVTEGMPNGLRVMAMDWFVFGQRNHKKNLRTENYGTQYPSSKLRLEQGSSASFHFTLEQLREEHSFLRELAKDPLRCKTALNYVDADSILDGAISPEARTNPEIINPSRPSKGSGWDYSEAKTADSESKALKAAILQSRNVSRESAELRVPASPGSASPSRPNFILGTCDVLQQDLPRGLSQDFGLSPGTPAGASRAPQQIFPGVSRFGFSQGNSSASRSPLPAHFNIGKLLPNRSHNREFI